MKRGKLGEKTKRGYLTYGKASRQEEATSNVVMENREWSLRKSGIESDDYHAISRLAYLARAKGGGVSRCQPQSVYSNCGGTSKGNRRRMRKSEGDWLNMN